MTIEEMEKLALEEHELKEKIPQAKKENRRKKRKYKLKRTKATLKLLSVISCIPITQVLADYGATKASGKNIWSEEIPALITEEIDSDGNIKEEKVYSDEKVKSHLTYYTYWNENKNGYSREVYTYDLSLTESDKLAIINMINNEESLSIKTLKKVLKEIGTEKIKESKRKEYKLELSKKELAQRDYIEATIRTTNKLDTIEIPESIAEIVGAQLVILVLLSLMFLIILAIDEETEKKLLNTFLNKQKEDIKSKPELEDIEVLKERLKQIEELLKDPELILDDLDSESEILEIPEQLNQPEPQKVLKKEPKRMQQQGQ